MYYKQIVILTMLLVQTVYSQALSAPQNLTASNQLGDVDLFWESPIDIPESTWLSYWNEQQTILGYTSFGHSGLTHFYGIRFGTSTLSDYYGYSLNKIAFIPTDNATFIA